MRDIMRIKSSITPEGVEAMNKVKALGNEMWAAMEAQKDASEPAFSRTNPKLANIVLAQRKLEEAVMWFSKAVSDEGEEQ